MRIIESVNLERYYRFRTAIGLLNGVTVNKRQPPVIVSLTTTLERLPTIYLCVASLLCQSFVPDALLLWVPETLKAQPIPKYLNRLKKKGLEIEWCRDVGPHTKLIHTLRDYPQAIIVTADDDCLYPPTWLRDLYESYMHEPSYIHCHRAHFMELNAAGKLKRYRNWNHLSPGMVGPSSKLFPTGVGGILYPPTSLNQEVFNEAAYMVLCPKSDDIWFKAMALLNHMSCKKVHPYHKEFPTIIGTQTKKLWSVNEMINDAQIGAVFQKYDLYKALD